MEPLFFSTGQVARELAITQARVRDLCRNGAIEAETTAGGQFRISREVVDRLRRDGVPDTPRPMPNAEQALTVIPPPVRRSRPALLSAPSDVVIESSEALVCLQNELQSLALRQQKEEQLDWFRERERQGAERARQRLEAEQRRQAQFAADQRRETLKTTWLQRGLNRVPDEAPQSVRLDVHEAVVEALDRLDPGYLDFTVEQLVSAAVDRALKPWRTAKQVADAIKGACEAWNVPWDMRHDTTWKARMYQAAGAVVSKLRDGATIDEVKIAASQAVVSLVQEFEHGKVCTEIANNIWNLSGETSEEREQGKDAVRAALAKLPIGASKREMEKARDDALEPIRGAIAARRDREMRDRILEFVELRYKFKYLSHEERQKALGEVREAFHQLPAGTAEAALKKAIDTVIDRFHAIHEQHEREKKKRRGAKQSRCRSDATRSTRRTNIWRTSRTIWTGNSNLPAATLSCWAKRNDFGSQFDSV